MRPRGLGRLVKNVPRPSRGVLREGKNLVNLAEGGLAALSLLQATCESIQLDRLLRKEQNHG
jgi:hypothetical protein